MIEGYKWPYRISEAGVVECGRTGAWVPLVPTISHSKRARVSLRLPDGKAKYFAVSHLMADAFMGGVPEGYGVFHKNPFKLDNELENLEILPLKHGGGDKSSKSVFKIDPLGNVVEIYRSAKEAAAKNHMSVSAMYERCQGKIKDPARLDGYTYQYEDRFRGKPRSGLKYTKT